MPLITPKWSAPNFVKACTYAHSDIQHHAKYHPQNFQNHIQEQFHFKNPAIFIEQIHSDICICVDESNKRIGDALITQKFHQALCIQTADCLPILISHRHLPQIANIHAGWKGLDLGIIENTFSQLPDIPQNYLAWIGPAICMDCYEVGLEFKKHILKRHPNLQEHFHHKNNWHFDLTGAARSILQNLGVIDITEASLCTFENEKLFSFRRQQNEASRLATLIWLENENDH